MSTQIGTHLTNRSVRAVSKRKHSLPFRLVVVSVVPMVSVVPVAPVPVRSIISTTVISTTAIVWHHDATSEQRRCGNEQCEKDSHGASLILNKYKYGEAKLASRLPLALSAKLLHSNFGAKVRAFATYLSLLDGSGLLLLRVVYVGGDSSLRCVRLRLRLGNVRLALGQVGILFYASLRLASLGIGGPNLARLVVGGLRD